MTTTTATAGSESRNVWMASAYAGVITALLAVVFTLLFQAEQLILYIIALLLIGAGPVLGYQLSRGKIFSDWKAIIGGIVGMILLFIGWPILVGALSKDQSVGKLFLGSLLGIVLGVVVFLLLQTLFGQNPYFVGTSWVLLSAVWGGTCGAAMEAWRRDA
jgi:hypothetical protein